jgi:hypothetical protein
MKPNFTDFIFFEASRDLGIMVVAVLATAVVLMKFRRLIFFAMACSNYSR